MSEREIMAALARGEDVDTVVNREALRYAVQRQITCPQSGRLLDVRTAVLVELTGPDGKTVSAAYDARWWDEVRERVEVDLAGKGFTVTVHDGRTLFGRKGRKK